MRTIWQSLAWKEWHEHKWKLAAATAIVVSMTTLSCLFFIETAPSLIILLTYSVVPLSVFIGAGDAAGERSQNTLPFIQSIPTPSWKTECWKIAFGLISCVAPIIFALAAVAAVYGLLPERRVALEYELQHSKGDIPIVVHLGHVVADWAASAGLLAAVAGASIYLWTVAIGVKQRSEGHAISIALAVIVGCWTLLWILAASVGRLSLFLWGAAPGGLALLMGINEDAWAQVKVSIGWGIGIAIAAHILLLARCIFCRQSVQTRNTSAVSRLSGGWLTPGCAGPPCRSPLTAILWKQFRESAPIAAVGMTVILFFLCVNVLVNRDYYFGEHTYLIAEMHASLTIQIGFLVVLIVGIGVFDRDLGPKLHTFWRSRPINPNLWYWTKYLTGLVVLVMALGVPVLLSGTWYFLSTGWSQRLSDSLPPHLNMLAMLISILVAIYALAVTAICLVRVTVYAAVLSVGVVAGGVCLAWYFLGEGDAQHTVTDWTNAITAMTGIAVLLSTFVGWWAVRRDIGWKNQ